MPPDTVPDSFRRRNRGRARKSSKFKSDITQVCQTCAGIDLAFMLEHAREFMYQTYQHAYQLRLETFQEIQAKAGEFQLCRAWLQLLPKFEAHVDQNYTEQGIFILNAPKWGPLGAFDLLDSSTRAVRLYIEDEFRVCRGVVFLNTVNDGSFYLKRDDLRWNEISLQVDFSLPLKWMKFCEENHEACNATHEPQLDKLLSVFRLIDCERALSSGELQVVCPDGITEYTALSCVWGGQPDDKSSEQAASADNTDNGRDKCSKNRLEILPKVIQNSIWTTKQLGLKYLWADKYCIDQEDSISRHESIMKMDLIYSAAKIVIVAATGSKNSHGLSGAGSTTRTPLKSIKVSNKLSFVPIKHAIDYIQDSVWATRAWTLQEGLLAR